MCARETDLWRERERIYINSVTRYELMINTMVMYRSKRANI